MQKRQRIFVASVTAFTVAITGSSVALAWQRDQSIIVEVKPELELPDTVFSENKTGLWVTGDSVILGIRFELDTRQHIGLINARVGRQAPELLEVIEHDKTNMQGAPIVLNLGNNNKLSEDQVAAIFEAIADQPKIVVVNTAVPRGWRDENNALIAQYAARYGADLVDWAAVSDGHPEYFGPDGVHLVPAGVRAYVDAITSKL